MGLQSHKTLGLGAALLGFFIAQAAAAQSAATTSTSAGGNSETQPRLIYPVGKFLLEYGPVGQPPHPKLPPLTDLLKVRVDLGRDGETYVPATQSGPKYSITLGELDKPQTFSAAALIAINRALVEELNRRGIYGAWAAPDSKDIEPQTGRDLRAGRSDLRLVISAAEVRQVRVIAKGTRIPSEQSTNPPAYHRIAENSPLHGSTSDSRGSLLEKARLNDYVGRLNRFPGRAAAAAVSATEPGDAIALDYLISEDRPWVVYSQVANTGTAASGDWRERFGFIDQQLTGHDDILAFDYITANFQYSESIFGTYEFPLIYPDRIKAKVFGSWGDFTADEYGMGWSALKGSSAIAGGEFTFSPFDFGAFKLGRLAFAPMFLDIALGMKWQGVEMNNGLFGTDTSTDFLLPYLGLSLGSSSPATRLTAGIQLEGNLAQAAGTDPNELPGLGRLDTDNEWVLTQWGAGFSFFLDPLLARYNEKLIHELWFSAHGKFVFGNRRLVPQEAQLVGGAFSVRGYPESFDLGDNVYVGSAEYRFYLARALRPAIEERRTVGAKDTARAEFGNPYRFRSNDAYRRTDWDVILRTFVDGGQTHNNRIRPTETDRSLLSAGVGVEFQWRRNLNLRLDYGIVLKSETENMADPVDAGDSRVHFMATVAW